MPQRLSVSRNQDSNPFEKWRESVERAPHKHPRVIACRRGTARSHKSSPSSWVGASDFLARGSSVNRGKIRNTASFDRAARIAVAAWHIFPIRSLPHLNREAPHSVAPKSHCAETRDSAAPGRTKGGRAVRSEDAQWPSSLRRLSPPFEELPSLRRVPLLFEVWPTFDDTFGQCR